MLVPFNSVGVAFFDLCCVVWIAISGGVACVDVVCFRGLGC